MCSDAHYDTGKLHMTAVALTLNILVDITYEINVNYFSLIVRNCISSCLLFTSIVLGNVHSSGAIGNV